MSIKDGLAWVVAFLVPLLKLLLSLTLVGFAATCLVVLAPGFGVDERELDSRLSADSIESIKNRSRVADIPATYWRLLRLSLHGDLGYSLLLDRPVRELIGERYITTARLAGVGWVIGWATAAGIAAFACMFPGLAIRGIGISTSSLLLCFPAALVAFAVSVARGPASLSVGILVFARVYPIVNSLFEAALGSSYVIAAKSRGVSDPQIFARHILSATATQLLALAGTSIVIAIGLTIPVEVLADESGLGQLAYKAATGRDMTLLVNVTIVLAAVTMCISTATDALARHVRMGLA